MAQSEFLKGFQKNLADEIRRLLKIWKYDYLEVAEECSDFVGVFNGRVDICVYDRNDPNNRVIIIEIEHKSGYYQAMKNIDKIREWTRKSSKRKCGFLHIFNDDSNINENDMSWLIDAGKNYEREKGNFFYDFCFYEVYDGRKTVEIAQKVVNSNNFKTRFYHLMVSAQLHEPAKITVNI
jgi:hypothetical protein